MEGVEKIVYLITIIHNDKIYKGNESTVYEKDSHRRVSTIKQAK